MVGIYGLTVNFFQLLHRIENFLSKILGKNSLKYLFSVFHWKYVGNRTFQVCVQFGGLFGPLNTVQHRAGGASGAAWTAHLQRLV